MREAQPADADEILAAAHSCGVFTPDELRCLGEDLQACLDGDYVEGGIPDRTRVLVDQGRIVAFVHFGYLVMTDRAWMLHWIFVLRQTQGSGYGRLLLNAVERDVADAGGRILFIETSGNAEFEAARAFYLRCGYELTAQVADYYGAGNPKCVFSRRVRAAPPP